MANKSIAFYSPLKPADHPVPSGDRLMAQSLILCLEKAGYEVVIASRLRVFFRDPHDEDQKRAVEEQAALETQRLATLWQTVKVPDIWFCYHPYYKSPDLIGPGLCKAFDIPYVTAEASCSARRNQGIWTLMQQRVLESIDLAAINICFTGRDKRGLLDALPGARVVSLRPFIETREFIRMAQRAEPGHLVTVAMMRSGDKMRSYTRLAAALEKLGGVPWKLSIVGDGPLRAEVHALFSSFAEDRILWHGELARADIAALFASSSIYVWPGCAEAYGLAYLEAQAAGLPVVAYDNAGVPEVVVHGISGVLTRTGDDQAYAAAIEHLLIDKEERNRLAATATAHVQQQHSAEQASRSLACILQQHTDAA